MLTVDWRHDGERYELWLSEDAGRPQRIGFFLLGRPTADVCLVNYLLSEWDTIAGALPVLATTPLRGGKLASYRLWSPWLPRPKESADGLEGATE